MADQPGADLDQLLPEAGERPVFDRLGRCQRAQEVAEIVGERVKLKPHGIGSERPARQPRPLDRALAFLDPLLGRAAPIVEGENPLGRAEQVGDDEADARNKLARMPLDFGDNPAWLGPAFGLIGKIGVEPPHMVRGSPDGALEQAADPVLQDAVGGDADRVFLTNPEKRAVLAAWASDANAVSHLPALRQLPDGSIVKLDDISRPLKALDEPAERGPKRGSLLWKQPFKRRRMPLRQWLRRGRWWDDDGGLPFFRKRSKFPDY